MLEMHRALDPGMAAAETPVATLTGVAPVLGQPLRTSDMEHGPTAMHGQLTAMPPGLSRFAGENPMEQTQGTGVFGYYQGLLQSFTSGSNDMTHSVTNGCGGGQKRCHEVEEQGHDNTAQWKTNEEISGECSLRYDANIDDIGSPSRLGVDESGYYSSASSVYDIYSDDEYFGNDNDTRGVPSEEYNVDDLTAANAHDNTVEEGINAFNQEEMVSPTATATCSGADAVEDCPCLNGNPFMHVMTDLGDGTHTWKKRNRSQKGVKRPESRVPKGIGPVEIALRNAPNHKTKYIFEPLLGITFDSEGANNKEKNLTGRILRCLCAGNPKRCEFNSKKTDCKAMLRLLRSEDDGWYISGHIAEHNHPLTISCGETKEWFSHRRLDPRAMDMIRYLRENNVSLTKVHCIMGSMYGSMENVPFTKRSLQSICHRIAKDQMDDDVQKTLCAFRELRKKDPGFQFSVLPNEHNRIKALLWINGKSWDQYKFFGDVLTFDTTYCTNIYKMPFGLFVDQCVAMASALSKVWKETMHLLCKWHVFKDAPAKLDPIYRRGSEFRKLFHKIINDMLTIDEFERAWDYMLNRFKLKDNEYLKALYDKKEKWAKAYFSDCFCAKMSSTQRSESANHMLKRFVPRNCSMNRFIVQFNKLLLDRNNAEDRAEFDTKIVNCVRKRAWPIEEHAAKVYTSAVHSLFRKEVDKSTNYFAIEKVEKKEFDVVHVKPQFKLPWGREKLTVVNNGCESYDCECGLYRHFGVLCSHVLRVMVQIGAYEIPKAHIMKRWTRSAREILPGQYKTYEKDTLCMESMTYRNRYLYLDAIAVVADGNKDLGAFDIVATSLKEIKRKLEHYFRSKENEENGGAGARMLVGARESKYYTTESDVGVDSASEAEPTLYNSYGAAGSSAAMTDSKLLSMKAPLANRPPGRPRQNRLKGALDYFGKKHKKNAGDNAECSQNKKRRIRCSECKLIGHSASVCKKIIDLTAGIPDF